MKDLISARLTVLVALLSLVAVHLSPAIAAPASQLITCIDLQSGKERISKSGSCRVTHEAQAKWHLVQSDSPIATGSTSKSLTICSNREISSVAYQIIRSKCARHQVSSLYSRSTALASKPIIAQAVSYGHDSSQISLAQDPATNPDAPIAFYTITSSKGNTQKIYSWRELNLVISGLQALTTYTFTVTATTADGTSPVSATSIPVTTPAYVPPAPAAATTPVLAAPAFTLSSIAETVTVNNSASGFTVVSNTGGTIASYAISATPPGMTFNAATGALSGTPNTVASATTYTITATNASGSATCSFILTVTSVPLDAPAFTLSAIAETVTVNTLATGFTIASNTGGTIASFAISATPPGMTFNTSTGALTGTPTTIAGATSYTVTATNATGSAARSFTLTVTALVYTVGMTGPGGGTIFYVGSTFFTQVGATGSMCTTTCKYLEAAPNTWVGGSSDPAITWSTGSNRTSAVTGADGNVIGTGYQNSLDIVAQTGNLAASSAAVAARAYTGGSKNDWFLPSKDELALLYAQKTTVGGFVADTYWSSSERDTSNAWSQYLAFGQQGFDNKLGTFYVRPVRAF